MTQSQLGSSNPRGATQGERTYDQVMRGFTLAAILGGGALLFQMSTALAVLTDEVKQLTIQAV